MMLPEYFEDIYKSWTPTFLIAIAMGNPKGGVVIPSL